MQSINPLFASGNSGASAFHAPTGSTPPRKFAKATPDLIGDSGLTPSERLLLLALALDDWKPDSERFHPSNATLARAVGLKPRQIQKLLASLQAKGRIAIEPHGNPTHRCIRRVEPKAEPAPSSAPPPCHPVRTPRALPDVQSRPLPLDPPLDPIRKPESIQANGNGQTPTPGQSAFLASLTPDRRAKFFELSEGKRSQILAPHANAFRPELMAIQGPELDRSRSKPTEPIPQTVTALLAGLPGSPPDWATRAAGALSEDFGSKVDRAMWPEFQKIADAVRVGTFPAEALADAYRQATAPKIEKPGAVFNIAVRRHGWK